MALYGKFGEFDSADGLNELAGNLLKEGDKASIKALAKENGIPEEFAKMFISGDIPVLCDVQTAAVGKIDVEAKELKPQDIMADWTEYIKAVCMEDEAMAVAVRKKDKSLKGCIAALLKWSFGHQQPVDKDILKEAKVSAGKVTLGIPGQATARKLIRGYYGGTK